MKGTMRSKQGQAVTGSRDGGDSAGGVEVKGWVLQEVWEVSVEEVSKMGVGV